MCAASPAPAADPGDSPYQVPNLERALLILETLASPSRHHGLSLTELASALGVSKNSVFRITLTLVNHGYLHRDPVSKRFSLTRKLLALGFAALGESNLLEKSGDVLRALRDLTRETVLLGTLLDAEGIVLDQAPGTHSFKFHVDPGTRFRLHSSAPGKALLAFLPAPEREALLLRLALTRYNDRTLTTRPALLHCLEEARHLGYALDRAEEYEGVHCVAAPVRDHSGYPVAVIWLTAPSSRLPEEELAHLGPRVAAHAALISQRLGFGLLPGAPAPSP